MFRGDNDCRSQVSRTALSIHFNNIFLSLKTQNIAVQTLQLAHQTKITQKLFPLVLPESLILNQESSGGNNLKRIRYTHQESLKSKLNLERAHRNLMSRNLD